jgi:type I restriction enzyme M protein
LAVKKSEIYSSLWASCDALRGGMDASLYKDYVLVLLFVKYVSDKYAGDPNGIIEVPKGGSFADMVALKGDKEIGEKINIIIAKLAEANNLKGVIDVADFNDPDKLGGGKEMVDRLSSLVAIFNRPELDFRRNRAEGDDIMGDAYEYLMRHFATESGKSKGQFYTPAEVSRIMAKAIGVGGARSAAQTVYDPTCGSGSLLLKAHDEAPYDLTIYGQEMDVATSALAKMNMVLHNCPTAEIWKGNTLSTPHFVNDNGSLKTFDFVVANPHFSNKAWSTGFDPANDQFHRFDDGVPPTKNGDYAYLMHVIASLKSNGKGAIILPHGVLFRGNAEGEIRKKIVAKGIIKGIIGLPANLFYGTGIPACIVVLDKENAHARKGIFMIDASKGFVKDGNKNRLRAQDIHKIVDAFTRQLAIEKYSRMVPLTEIEKQDFNLNIPRYIDSSEPEDLQDIEAHLKGGIPLCDIDALSGYWAVMPSVRGELFGPGDRAGYAVPKVEPSAIKAAILKHAEFAAYADKVAKVFAGWRAARLARLKAIKVGDHPKTLIEEIAEDLLGRFSEISLIDKYDIYQHLMTYWAETMQDDLYILAQDGWKAAREIRELVKNSEGKFTEAPDIVIGKKKLKAELIPPPLIIVRFFAKEQAALEAREAKVEEVARTIEEMDEEHGGEDGLLAEAKADKGKLTAKSIKERIASLAASADASLAKKQEIIKQRISDGKLIPDSLKKDLFESDLSDILEFEQLQKAQKLIEAEKEASDAAKEAKVALDADVVKRYAKLTDDEVKLLLVEDKWLAALRIDIESELDRISQGLTGRVKLLTERYAVPLSQLAADVDERSVKVSAHLKRMGFAA